MAMCATGWRGGDDPGAVGVQRERLRGGQQRAAVQHHDGARPELTGAPEGRPALLAGVDPEWLSRARPGCFEASPPAGNATTGYVIGHNFGRGPAAANLALRVARTWALGREDRRPGGRRAERQCAARRRRPDERRRSAAVHVRHG